MKKVYQVNAEYVESEKCTQIDNKLSFCRCIAHSFWDNKASTGMLKVYLASIHKGYLSIHLEFVAPLPQLAELINFWLSKDLFSQHLVAFYELTSIFNII